MIDKTDNAAAIELAARLYATTNTTDSDQLESDVLRLADGYIAAIACQMLQRKPSADQMQDARLGALMALRSYDPTRAQYKTWLYPYVKKELFRNASSTVQIPEYMRCLMQRLAAFESSYPTATDKEVCLSLEITPSQLCSIRQAQGIIIADEDDRQGEVDSAYEQADTKADVRAALDRLGQQNPAAQEVALLFFLRGYTLEQIEDTLHIQYHTAKKRLGEAMVFLRCELADYE